MLLLLTAMCGLGCADSDHVETDAAPPAELFTAVDGGGEESMPAAYTESLVVGEWDSMDIDARKKFMREMVLPRMREVFGEFDAVRFERVSCKTCHGGGTGDGSFAMPAAELPMLSSQSLMNPEEDDVAISDFMRNVMKPELAGLLGIEPGSKPGLRCSTCHVIAE